MAGIEVLVAVREEHASRYHKNLSMISNFRVRIVTNMNDAYEDLGNPARHTDVLVLDNGLDDGFTAVRALRNKFSRLVIVLVDEEADFALPGQADDISTDPFSNGDLARRINRLMSDRSLETLRADAMPPVREFAKKLRKAVGEFGKQEAAVKALRDIGYDYVAFYRIDTSEPMTLTLKAQEGSPAIQSVAPKQASPNDLMTWVATNGQSRVAAPTDEINHPLVKKSRLGAAAAAVVGGTNRYGVLVACREKPDSISPQDVLILELVCAQLAAVSTRE